MNKSVRFGPILFLLLTGYILSSCKTTVFVQNAPTPNATAVATSTVDPLATPSLDLTATPQVTGTPNEDDDDQFGNLTGIVGLVTFKDGKIKIYITLNGVDKIIVREAEKSDHSGDNSGDDSGKKDGDSH